MRYSISLEAQGDREVTLDEVVELADAVAGLGGIASGMGTMGYGAQIIVEADTSAEAVEIAMGQFQQAAERASLPPWPVVRAESLAEDEDYGDLDNE